MSIETEIFDGLTGNASLFALINARVFPHVPRGLPQQSQLPAVTYQQISGVSQFTHEGLMPLTEARFQFNAFGRTALEVNEVMSRLLPALQDIGTAKITAIEGPRDAMDPIVTTNPDGGRMRGLPWKSIDVFMWYQL